MTRSDIIKRLHAMVDERLFGPNPWYLDKETADALKTSFERMGLEERVPCQTETWRTTVLGKELQLELMMVFMGFWYEAEVPWILKDHGLVDEPTAELLLDRMYDPRRNLQEVLLPVVRRAYRDYFHPSRLPN